MAQLNSPYFKNNARIKSAASGGPPLVKGESSNGVAVMQAGLVDLGYSMPRSTKPGGSGAGKAMDGVFGEETKSVLMSFQAAQTLKSDGIAGPLTLTALDQKLSKKSPPQLPIPKKNRKKRQPAPVPPPIVVPPSSPQIFDNGVYKTGAQDPPLEHDPGAGVWNSKPTEVQTATLKLLIESQLDKASVYPGPNAVRHMRHYFANHGRPLSIDLEGMIKSVPIAQEALLGEFRQAQRFILQLPVGRHQFTSKSTESAYNYKDQSADWFFAIGGYSYWGKGTADVSMVGGQKQFDVEFFFKFYDRYNWDGDKSVTLLGVEVTDKFMGEFHRQGLAREFDCFGQVVRRVRWLGNVSVPPDSAVINPPGR